MIRNISKQNLPSFVSDICLPFGQNICKNGGTCVVKDENKLSCRCPKEFDGNNCENGKLQLWF